MAPSVLPTSAFAQARKVDRNTLIENTPQESVRRKAPPQQLYRRSIIASPMSDSFPTPKTNMYAIAEEPSRPASPTSSDTQSDGSSEWSKRSSRSGFDSLYDATDSESEGEVPIKLSGSIKKRQMASRRRYPSIVIPSPSEWPSVDKLKSAVTPLSPPIQITLASSMLAHLQAQSIPSSSAAPSLAGSITDEEMALSSCPSTPDICQHADEDQPWELPIQLDHLSLSMLEHISGDDHHDQLETVIEVPEEATSEMREIVQSPPLTARMRLETQNIAPAPVDPEDELTALSVPSPGGFFSSLSSSVARHTWCAAEPNPNTSTATNFYDVPFSRQTGLATSTATSFYNLPWGRSEDPIEHTVEIEEPVTNPEPITARKLVFSPVKETILEVEEIDEKYNDVLQKSASIHIDRTALWLNAQNAYMKAICEDDNGADIADSFKDLENAAPKTPEQTTPAVLDTSPAKKSVRFIDEELTESPKPIDEPVAQRISPIHDGTFWDGWRHNKRSQRARDVFQHRQARAEAEHVKRTSSPKQYADQLQGRFEIVAADRPSPKRPISKIVPDTTPEDEKAQTIKQVERERQALEQMQESSWNDSAREEVVGGKLLTSPIVQSWKGRKDIRILDLGGQPHCSWAWNVAYEHPSATVCTTVFSDLEAHIASSSLEGPTNHAVVAAPEPWHLPFESSHFDIISARNLYAHLKLTWVKHQGADEWDLTLRECLRCLKPGGYLEFDLLDAELVHPEAAAQALGVEFAFNLKTRGYDPNAGRGFLPRLKRAGFLDIKRAWMVLPVADVLPSWTDSEKRGSSVERTIEANGEVKLYQAPVTGSTKDVRALTGLVGARMWEQWMLKLNSEMGRSESRCLEGVAKAFEESGKGNAGWRYLVGWARKDL